jgi:hypothetical protein
MAPRDGFSNITGQRQHSEEQAATFTISGQHDNMLERKRERQIKPLKKPKNRGVNPAKMKEIRLRTEQLEFVHSLLFSLARLENETLLEASEERRQAVTDHKSDTIRILSLYL